MKIAVYIPTLAGGGAERVMLTLAEHFAAAGHDVDLVVNRNYGPYTRHVPEGLRVVELCRSQKWRGRLLALLAAPGDFLYLARPVLFARKPLMTLRYLPGLVAYLKREKPAALVSALFYTNLLAIWGRGLSGTSLRLIVSEHNTLSSQIKAGLENFGPLWRWSHLSALLGRCYLKADAIVAVSDGVADDLASTAGTPRSLIQTIYNPVFTPALAEKMQTPVEHSWFAECQPPLLLAAGRLTYQKDFETLIRAFAQLRARRPARLMILGEGPQRETLTALAQSLGIESDIQLPGWVDNPYAYMAQASLFVLSSRHEGLPTVLIEALACGCPVVSTDCPHGPAEILAGGRYGELVPVGDVARLADAMARALDHPLPAETLRARGAEFSVERSVAQYLALLAPDGKTRTDDR
jgi:glycosyltransferase involved in cell wall biosynthesis